MLVWQPVCCFGKSSYFFKPGWVTCICVASAINMIDVNNRVNAIKLKGESI